MAQKTKKMTIKYWNSLSDGAKKRALTYVFPLHKAIVEMLMNEKPDPKNSDWWKMVFEKVRIPAPGSYYKTVVNNTYLNLTTMIFTEEDRLRELRLAQKDIYNAGNDLVSAGLRLQGTKYEKSYERIYKSLNALNRRLISEINKNKRRK